MLGFSSCFFLYCWLAVVDMLFWWTSNAWEKENDNGTNWCQVQCTWREEEKNPKEKSTVLLLLVPRVKPRCVKAERACATVFFFSEHCVRKEEEGGDVPFFIYSSSSSVVLSVRNVVEHLRRWTVGLRSLSLLVFSVFFFFALECTGSLVNVINTFFFQEVHNII